MRNDAESLKLAFPEVTLAMECDQLRNSLTNRLKLQAKVTQADLTAEARVELNGGYYLILRPDYTGYNGVNFWFKWNTFQDPETGEDRIFHQLRCVVELHKTNEEEGNTRIISFGQDATSTARAMEKAMAKIADLQGLRLVPLPITEIL
jgi:exonuclease III